VTLKYWILLFVPLLVSCGSNDPSPAIQMSDDAGASEDSTADERAVEPPAPDDVASGDTGLASDTAAAADTAVGNDTASGPDLPCVPSCLFKQCGDDGCGGTCGACGPGSSCVNHTCSLACDGTGCTLGASCVDVAGKPAICGGTLTFDTDLFGAKLPHDLSVESLYGAAGVLIATDNENSVAATNPYKVASPSGKNSCASIDGWGNYWLDDLVIRFVLPDGGSWKQGATHYVSVYIAQTAPGGIRVDYYSPENPPGLPGSSPIYQQYTQQQGTAFVEYMSPAPIGYVMVCTAADPDFTIDDLTFGPITAN
jgi:hypothetical protein